MNNLLILLFLCVLVIVVFYSFLKIQHARNYFLKTPVLVVVLLLTLGCSSNLHKIKSSELQQKNKIQEIAVHSQERVLIQDEKYRMVLMNDSATHWLWFQSAHPFWFHPTNGLVAESGLLYVGGNRVGNQLEYEHSLQSELTEKDSSVAQKTSSKEKILLKNKEKLRVKKFWLGVMVGLVLVVVVLWLFYKRLRFGFARRSK